MRKALHLLLFMMLNLLAAAQTNDLPEANANTRQIIAGFEKEMNNTIQRDKTGSIAVSIMDGEHIIWSKAFGKMNNQLNLPADTNTIYRIGSISKTIAAYLMMLLVQDGKIKLDDAVIKYVPELSTINTNNKDDVNHITFRQLASHTSGLAREPGDLINNATGAIEEWEDKVLRSIPLTTLNTPTGENFSYSNIGYAILGLAISRVAQRPFTELVQERIFQPLGMTNSFYIIPKGFENHIASGYHYDASSHAYSTSAAEKELTGRGYKVPNGGVFSTANDMARFAMALTSDNNVLTKNYCDTMQTIQAFINRKRNEGYGLGLFINEDDSGNKIIKHDGAVAGYNSLMILSPKMKLGVILLSNCDNTMPLLNRQGNILLNKLVKANTKN